MHCRTALTGPQMRALVEAGTAHPQQDTVVPFNYYDGSFWTPSKPTGRISGATTEAELWLRADDIDVACDPSFRRLRSPR